MSMNRSPAMNLAAHAIKGNNFVILKEYTIREGVCDFCQQETVCVSTESNATKQLCQNCIYKCVFEFYNPKPPPEPPQNQCNVCLENKPGRTWERDGAQMSVCDDCVFNCVLQNHGKNSWIEQNGDPISNLHKEIMLLKKELKEQLKDTLKNELRDEIMNEVRGK